MIIDLRFIRIWFADCAFHARQRALQYSIDHWWYAWHPVFEDGHLIWLRWVKRYWRFPRFRYCLNPSPHEWADYAPALRLIFGENPGRRIWRNGQRGDFTETKFSFKKKAS